jgi:hypothetical protein
MWILLLRLAYKVLLALFIAFSVVQTAQGAPQTAAWLNDLGVENSRLLGVLLTGLALLVGVGLFAGPHRIKAWLGSEAQKPTTMDQLIRSEYRKAKSRSGIAAAPKSDELLGQEAMALGGWPENDPLVRVAYSDQTGNDLVVRFDFPEAPVNRDGHIELVAGHGTRVKWVIELANSGAGSSRAHITILAPSHLIHYLDPVDFFQTTKTDFTAENMVSDGKNSLRFRGWFAPLMGGGRSTELEFQTTISYAYRDIPIRVQVDNEDGPHGLADVYLPIRAVVAPDGKPVRGR